MAQIWCELLGCEEVGDGDSFFELGGDSVLAMNLAFRVEEQTGAPVEVYEIFDTPRFGDFLSRISEMTTALS